MMHGNTAINEIPENLFYSRYCVPKRKRKEVRESEEWGGVFSFRETFYVALS